MKPDFLGATLAILAVAFSPSAWSQDMPGSDPIVLEGAVSYLALPTPAVKPSKQIEQGDGMPSWLQAKVTRYETKAFATLDGGDGTIYTERDVISTQSGNALQRNCTTEVASNTYAPGGVGPSGRYGPGASQDQIVVLRGDVVTICK